MSQQKRQGEAHLIIAKMWPKKPTNYFRNTSTPSTPSDSKHAKYHQRKHCLLLKSFRHQQTWSITMDTSNQAAETSTKIWRNIQKYHKLYMIITHTQVQRVSGEPQHNQQRKHPHPVKNTNYVTKSHKLL